MRERYRQREGGGGIFMRTRCRQRRERGHLCVSAAVRGRERGAFTA